MRSPKPAAESTGEVDRVYRILKAWILEARLRPGDLLSEVDLARQCETSRTPVREACNLLSQEKWIQRIRHKGYVVTPISIRDIVAMYEYRAVLECFNVERTTASATPEEVRGLREIVAFEDSVEHTSIGAFLANNQRFHLRLGEIAGNERVMDQLRLTLEYVQRLDVLSTLQNIRPLSHREIMRAIEARDSAAAARAMADHIHLSRDQIVRLFGK